MDRVRESLRVSNAGERAVRDSFCRHMSTILSNILQHPNDFKFRRLREENAVLRAELFTFPLARQLLEIAGFERTGGGGGGGGGGAATAWVFMHGPDDAAAMDVLRGMLQVVQQPPPDDGGDGPRAAPLEVGDGEQQQQQQQQQHDAAAGTAGVLDAARAALRGSSADAAVAQTDEASGVPLAPRFYSFGTSVGFEMRLEALNERMRIGGAAGVADFVVGLLVDPRNDGFIRDCLRVMRTLAANLGRDPAEARFRLLKFDNATLRAAFFPVVGAAELFIAVLGFRVCPEGLAKAAPQLDGDAAASEQRELAAAEACFSRVDAALATRRALEQEESARAGAAELRAQIEEEKRRSRVAAAASSGASTGAAAPDAPPRRRVPIAEALSILLGRQRD